MLSQILTDAYRRSKFHNVQEWKQETKCQLSTETVSKVLLRGVEPSIPTFITMAWYLEMPAGEIAAACKAAGDNVFCKLIGPSDIAPSDRLIMELAAKIPEDKKNLAIQLLKEMGR
jgi:hypothetical protein